MSKSKTFNIAEEDLLKRIAGRIIPPSADVKLPGADDDQIFNRVLSTSARQLLQLQQQLHGLTATEGGVSAISEWDETRFENCFSQWEQSWPVNSHPFFKLFMPLVLRAYYQDPRVQTTYDRRPGPPFPEGYALSDGDLSLLDQVRDRSKLYRS